MLLSKLELILHELYYISMKKVILPPLNNNKTFNFHEGGQDAEFDNALAKLDIMYDDIFKSEVQLDSIF